MGENASASMEAVNTAVTNAGTIASTALNTIMSNALFALGIGASVIGLAVGIVKKFLHVR